jgi:hypothetical protein
VAAPVRPRRFPVEVKLAYHVAFLVEDIAAAAPRFERALGVRFRPPEPLTHPDDTDDGPTPPLLSTYSYEGPPYVQLIQAQPTGVYGIGQGEGFHHFGVWVDNADECREVLGRDGFSAEKRFTDGDRTTAWYSDPRDLHGVRVEYTGETVRAGVESWLRGDISLADVPSHDS